MASQKEDIQPGSRRQSILYADESKRKASTAQPTSNALAEIRNPLASVSRAQLLQDVDNFATKHQLQDILPLLKKGALAAQNPHAIEQIPELDELDCEALHSEVTHRWKHPKALYFTIILNSIAAAVQGWDQTGSNSAKLSFPIEFGIPDTGAACEAAGTCDNSPPS